MATHNQVRAVGFLTQEPKIYNADKPGTEKVMFQIRTMRREIEGDRDAKFEDLIVLYDGRDFIDKAMNLKAYDLIDIKGVFCVMTVQKPSRCPHCGMTNIKYLGSLSCVYPISMHKLDNVLNSYNYNKELPEEILKKHYQEISNQTLIVGTVVSDPEMLTLSPGSCCRYKLGVNRKYYIKTQDDVTSDYPWVYSYGKQAEMDYTHLKFGSVVLVDGFMHNHAIKPVMTCEGCGEEYNYPDIQTDFVPYSVEYFSNYITDEEIAAEAYLKERMAAEKS